MSELTDLFKKIETIRVDIKDYLHAYQAKRFAFSNQLSDDTHLKIHHSGIDRKLKKDNFMLVRWDGEYPTKENPGESSVVQDAEYSLHIFAIKNNAILTAPSLFPPSFNTPSKDLKMIEDYLKQNEQHIIKYVDSDGYVPKGAHFPKIPDAIPNFKKINHIVYAKADIMACQDAPKNSPKRFFIATGQELLANVRKEGLSYTGDIVLHINTPTIVGSNYIEQEDIDSQELLSTDAVLFGMSLGGSKFKKKIYDTIYDMSNFVDQSGISYDTKNLLLIINENKRETV